MNAPAGWDCHVHVFDANAPTAGGHYRPVDRPLADIEALAAANGCGHLVLVQPSVYGTDNGVMLQALRASGGRHRGIAVVDAGIGEPELQALHEAGVRGIRFNLVSPVGSVRDQAARDLRQLAPRLRALGWHVQWYPRCTDLPQLAQWQQETGLPFVLDHLAGLTPAVQRADAAWFALAQLAGAGAWVKLSGWYRLESQAPHGDLVPAIQGVAELFGERLVWGSDWPHTSFAPDAIPAYGSQWLPVVAALGPVRAQAIRGAGAALYR